MQVKTEAHRLKTDRTPGNSNRASHKSGARGKFVPTAVIAETIDVEPPRVATKKKKKKKRT